VGDGQFEIPFHALAPPVQLAFFGDRLLVSREDVHECMRHNLFEEESIIRPWSDPLAKTRYRAPARHPRLAQKEPAVCRSRCTRKGWCPAVDPESIHTVRDGRLYIAYRPSASAHVSFTRPSLFTRTSAFARGCGACVPNVPLNCGHVRNLAS
jgi:hypothetical protein